MEKVFIIKKSGEKEAFSFSKLKKSLQRSGATSKNIDLIIETIKPQLYNGISSKEIYRKAFSTLKKSNRTCASKYSLKRALFELGPTGYPFERLVSALLKDKGYKTEVSVILQGECVTHEIDVLAKKGRNTYTVECKFHSKPHFVNNVKIPLYINSRFIDVQKKWNSNPNNSSFLKQGWIVTNTKFTLDAIKYAKCVDLNLLSWDYPKNNGLGKNIDEFGLYPITALTTITKQEKEQIIENDIVLIKELKETPAILDKIGISSIRVERILNEVNNLI
jgi:Holliday junction resolvase-like predicted endonuclease